jgi:dipeptidyl aminopeptidase/acylaminoacyl peptidase
MRYGWHPLKSYNILYSFFQYLLHQGYLILSVDYRGSSGYGRRYEEASYMYLCVGDLADVVAGADFLNGLGCVDPDSIGIFGLSYGGYLTLGALTKYPLIFAVGINIAGVYDWIQYAEWIDRAYVGAPWYGAFARLGGSKKAANADAWHNASPRNFINQLQRPLLNLMGTADANVDYAQIEAIVSDCVELRKDFSMMSYPNETHVFTHRATWVDAFTRIESAFERYLKKPLANKRLSMT